MSTPLEKLQSLKGHAQRQHHFNVNAQYLTSALQRYTIQWNHVPFALPKSYEPTPEVPISTERIKVEFRPDPAQESADHFYEAKLHWRSWLKRNDNNFTPQLVHWLGQSPFVSEHDIKNNRVPERVIFHKAELILSRGLQQVRTFAIAHIKDVNIFLNSCNTSIRDKLRYLDRKSYSLYFR